MIKRTHSIWLAALLAGATMAQAATLTFAPRKDNTLYQDASGASSNGAGQYLFVGKTNQGSVRRALLAFDLSSIPAGATITSATLTLNMSRTISGAQTTQLHRVLADWGEGTSNAGANEGGGASATTGDATWLHTFFNTGFWSSQGGDFSTTLSASQSVSGTGSYTWSSTAQMVADVQGWVDDPSTNFGWMLVGNESANSTAKRFDSREHPTASLRPQLTVEFTVPNTAPTVATAIADQSLTAGQAAFTRDLGAVFSDADGDALTYAVSSSNTSVATASISGSTLTVTPLAAGATTITLTADDGKGGSVSTSFSATVTQANTAPVVANAIADQSLTADQTAFTRDLSASPAVFSDADGDALTYTASSSNTAVAMASISGSILTVTPLAAGTTTIALTADDGKGGSISTSFQATVVAAGILLTGDFNGDNTVNFDDFFLFADHFGQQTGDPDFDPLFDLDGDGDVDFDDFFLFADNFGQSGN
jgi:hypothetical protein